MPSNPRLIIICYVSTIHLLLLKLSNWKMLRLAGHVVRKGKHAHDILAERPLSERPLTGDLRRVFYIRTALQWIDTLAEVNTWDTVIQFVSLPPGKWLSEFRNSSVISLSPLWIMFFICSSHFIFMVWTFKFVPNTQDLGPSSCSVTVKRWPYSDPS